MHNHTCLSCGTIIERGDFDCESDQDHDWSDCSDCAAVRAVNVPRRDCAHIVREG